MWGVRLVLAMLLLCSTHAYYFESGFAHHYTYWAETSLFGQGNVTTVLKFQITALNETEEGHRQHLLSVDSLVQLIHGGVALENPLKWDLSKTFLFTVDDKGSVRLVHCHPEDHQELLIIKKAIVSIFSVTVQIEDETSDGKYSAVDADHLGELKHTYNIQQNSQGMKLERKHFSAEDAHRFHEKTIHYNLHGTLHTAEAKDKILLKDTSLKSPKMILLPGEIPHKITVSGDFPDVETSATVSVKLDGKIPAVPLQKMFYNLKAESLYTEIKKDKLQLNQIKKNISKSFECIYQHPDKDDLNRSLCINTLRELLHSLNPEDYKQLVDGILGISCQGNDSCEDRRLVIIDVVARIGDEMSQRLLIKHVLSQEAPEDEELRRVFIHCAALKHPEKIFVLAVESFCFGKNGEHHGSRIMTLTQSRACLALGSLIRHLENRRDHDQASQLAGRLETWLDKHGEGDNHVSKRDTWLHDTDHEDHHISKAVLLHTLGNAALNRSKRHIINHALPNRGHQMWRRAALDALRHYKCEESAAAILQSLFHEDTHSVHRMALSIYIKHPLRHRVSKEQENAILSLRYTYPAVARVKRSLLDKVLFKFKLALPPLDWKKEVGSRSIGASFGISFENGIDGQFEVLSGYVDVNIHDKLWAEAHVGLINRQWDLLLIEACYKGRLSYNMNIVKDFTVGLYEDISSAFDHILNRILEPMEKVTNEIVPMYQDPKTNQSKSGFEPLAQEVKQLPVKTEEALQTTVDLMKAAEALNGMPIVTKIQQLAARAQSLVEDVHNEATDLFGNIVDTASTALPYAEKEIKNSINMVMSGLRKASEAPQQALNFIQKAQMGYHMSLQIILEGNSIIKQATSAVTGSRSSFMNSGHELSDIVEMTRQLVSQLKANHARRKRDANPFGEAWERAHSELDRTLNSLYEKADKMVGKVTDLVNNSSRSLQEGLNRHSLYTEILKNGFESFKEGIDMAVSRISALFGTKFFPGFPNQRRPCDSTCGCGYFPTDCSRYGHPGLDLKWDNDWKIPSPVSGMMYPADRGAVKIQPKTQGLTNYEIILSNIIINESYHLHEDGVFVNSGDIIAVPVGNNGCEESHFHIAMRKISNEAENHLCYYVDPSPYLDRMEPIPTWHQECKDFTFKHIGQVIDFHNLTKGFQNVLQILKSFAVAEGKQLLIKELETVPANTLFGPLKSIAGKLISDIDPVAGNLKNLFTSGTNAAKNFFRNISSVHFSLGKIMNLTDNAVGSLINGQLKESLNRVMDVVHTAQNIVRQPAVKNMTSMAMGALQRVWSSRQVLTQLPSGMHSLLQPQNRSKQDVMNAFAGIGMHVLSSVMAGGADKSSPNSGQGCVVDTLLKTVMQSGMEKLGSTLGVNTSQLVELSSRVVSSVSGRLNLVTALKASVCQQCPSFGHALAQSAGATCMPHKDCLGFECDAEFKWRSQSDKLSIIIQILRIEQKVNITVGGHHLAITSNRAGPFVVTEERTISSGANVLDTFPVKLKVNLKWGTDQVIFSLILMACTAERCLPDIKLATNLQFSLHTQQSHTEDGSLGKLVSAPLSGLTRTISDFSLPLSDISKQFSGVVDSISEALHPDMTKEHSAEKEFKNPTEHKDLGAFPPPGQNGEFNAPFFVFDYPFPVGPCVFHIYFSAGGALGMSFDVQVQSVNSFIRTEIKPYIAGHIEARFSLSIGVASAGIDLTGYLLRTSFPLSLTTNYTKQPVVSRKSLDVELIPLELKLTAHLKIVFVIHITKVLWQWRADPIRTTVWEKITRKDDTGPPRFPYCDKVAEICTRTTLQSETPTVITKVPVPSCLVTQLSGRHPKDPAFRLDFITEDDDSDLKVWYAIGDYPGGTNVQDWSELRGFSLVVPAILPCGIPLYFTVKAKNTQGLEAISQCSLLTYDCTFPDGRVDMAYKCSSHPKKLGARIVMYEDSELKEDGAFHGVGYSPSSYGHEVVNWLSLNISKTHTQQGTSGALINFDSARPGRLTSTPKQTLHTSNVEDCALECIKLTTCVSFSYEQYLHVCELQEVVEGPNAERKTDNYFQTFERLGKAYTAVLKYENLPLRHGTRYFVNVDVENVLGYKATMKSLGTMVDFTGPEPAYTGENANKSLLADGCSVSILQRCENPVPESLNHRKIIDGIGSIAVLNGNRKGEEMLVTMENFQAAANWNEFKDEECGIHGYTWGVGTTVCADDVVSFQDPHASLSDPSDWTNIGVATGLSLLDGMKYYVTVQAVNDIIFGGDLVTTVCHSTTFVVDTTPPSLDRVRDVLFDDNFHFLVIYFNAFDTVSGISRVEFGLGSTKYDVMVRRYIQYEVRGVAGNNYITDEDFEMNLGTPAYIRLKVTNTVGLSTAGYGESPILIDNSPPIAGHVLDGDKVGQDIDFQSSDTQICAQWIDFYDPESTIDHYKWGVGHSSGKDDVVNFQQYNYTKQSCTDVKLSHNTTYYSTVIAYNKALNEKSVNVTSNGVLVDITPPVRGTVADGSDVENDKNFTSESAMISASWANFSDPESGLAPFSLHVYVNNVLQRTFTNIDGDTFSDSSFNFQDKDNIYLELEASNRAGSRVVVRSDGMLVDHSVPELKELHTANYSLFQQNDEILHFTWQFNDDESGIAEYRCVVLQNYEERESKFWPKLQEYHLIVLNATSSTKQDLHLEQMNLTNGAQYRLQVTAFNRAELSVKEKSNGITVDVTPPIILKVALAPLGAEEEVNENNEVELVDGKPVWVTWSASDVESGISETQICISQNGLGDCFASPSTSVQIVPGSSVASTSFSGLDLQVSSQDQPVLYQAHLIAINRAGIKSSVSTSKPFLVVKANVPGVVLDGWKGMDEDFSYDKSSIAVTFSGFSSEACGIVGYEWAIGTKPFYTDVMPFTDFGLVMNSDGSGYAETEIMQFEGQKYFSTVRAKTGYNCHEQYIVASSDGFTLDTTPPTVAFHMGTQQVASYGVVYQTTKDKLVVEWDVNDSSGINSTSLLLNSFDSNSSMLTVSAVNEDAVAIHNVPSSGNTIVASVAASDKAGNEIVTQLPFITFDFDPPTVEDLKCTNFVSIMSALVTCTWVRVKEEHSPLDKIELGIGSGQFFPDIHNMTSVPLYNKQWSFFAADIISSKASHFYILVKATNRAGLQSTLSVQVIVDLTNPIVNSVSIVTSALPGYHVTEQTCQTSQDYMEVLLSGVEDKESGIKSVEIALGSSSGSADLRPFHKYPLLNGLYMLDHLSLTQGKVVYATVRVTNMAGLQTIGKSHSVVISPAPHLRVWDGPGDKDVDGQIELHVMQGHWSYSDPCPVMSVEWSVQDLTGQIITNYTTVVGNSSRLYNDMLTLENFRTYVNYVRIKDAANRTFTGFSDGVTVIVQRPETAAVRDGLTEDDKDFQEGTDCLSANWDDFGSPGSSIPSDQIVRYEAAVGTDTRHMLTRTNLLAFQETGLTNSITFCGLNLTSKSVTYYITVRAHSAAGSFAESSSDGIKVGYSSNITAGLVRANSFQSNIHNIRFWWTAFVSDMVITQYYVGVSSTPYPLADTTRDCYEVLDAKDFEFDVYPLQSMNTTSLAVLEGLSLMHGKSYFVILVATNQMGQCCASMSQRILVDTTPPVLGVINIQGLNTETVIYLHSDQTLEADLHDNSDPESGLKKAYLELFSSTDCNSEQDFNADSRIYSVSVQNSTHIAIRSLKLKENLFYFIRLTLTNGAGLESTNVSKPMILDLSPPDQGVIKVGTDWKSREQTVLNTTDMIPGMLALKSVMSNVSNCTMQVDLFSLESKLDWTEMRGDFTANCARFDNSGLKLIAQHDTFLTGVIRGAVQYPGLGLREGDYTFIMAAGDGDKILTGISLASPLLDPPFLLQNGILLVNQSLLPCNPLASSCLITNNTSGERMLQKSVGYGAGVSFFNQENSMKVLFWVQDKTELQQTWLKLDFDPTAIQAEYTLSFKRQENMFDSWDVSLTINGQIKGEFNGMKFSDDFVISAYIWNIDNYVPPVVDPFHPFKTVATIRSVAVPFEKRPLCTFGSPFHDHVSGIKEILFGISDDVNKTANVVPYRLVKSYCPACVLGCKQICSSCNGAEQMTGDYKVFSESLRGLNLQAANVALLANDSSPTNTSVNNSTVVAELDVFHLPTYFLDVKVVDHSGLYTEAKSVGIIVDTSPPVISSVHCFDPVYSHDEAAVFLGNNHSVGVAWDANDDVSSITEVWISLGTEPLVDDVRTKVQKNISLNQHIFDNLQDVLREGRQYFATVEVVNDAHLSSQAWSNFTVSTTVPDMKAMSVSMSYATAYNISNEQVALINSTQHLELKLQMSANISENLQPEYYEWAIGTKAGEEDVFPRTLVGFKGTRKVAIVNGFMQLDMAPGAISIGDYTKKNLSSDTPSNPKANLFNMEPGRCLSQSLYGVSKAHVLSRLDFMPTCIRRNKDLLVTAENSSSTFTLSGNMFVCDNNGTLASNPIMQLKMKLSSGGLLFGSLSNDDLSLIYGSAASTQYSPFIVYPDPRNDPTSRWLSKRLVKVPGPYFFLSPLAAATLDDDLNIAYALPADMSGSSNKTAVLLLWNAEQNKWMSSEEFCPGREQSFDYTTNTVVTKVCLEAFLISTQESTNTLTIQAKTSNQRSRRSSVSSKQVLMPRMFAVAMITSESPNGPPIVLSTSFSVPEDGNFTFALAYTDPENDRVKFSLQKQPEHGTASVTDNGELWYSPLPNFSGTDTILMKGEEAISSQDQAHGVMPHLFDFNITVTVESINDSPNIDYCPDKNDSEVTQLTMQGPDAGNALSISVFLSSNITTSVHLGSILYKDVDAHDAVEFVNKISNQLGASFETQDVQTAGNLTEGCSAECSGCNAKDLILHLDKEFSGNMSYEARVKDKAGAYGRLLMVNVYVLINPCVHGHCISRTPEGTCQELQRLHTFEPYFCKCDQGYESQWCDVETNECDVAACSAVSDCIDLIGEYQCTVNPGKLVAIFLGCALAIGAGLLAFFKLKKRKRVNPFSSESHLLENTKEDANRLPLREMQDGYSSVGMRSNLLTVHQENPHHLPRPKIYNQHQAQNEQLYYTMDRYQETPM